MTIDLTVAIPALNAAPTVDVAVRSVLDQADEAVEVLVVDDGSIDSTAEVAAAIGDRRVRILRGPGRGVASARNLVLHEAAAPWVAFLDADDEWLPGRLQALRGAIAARPDAVACFGAALHVDDAGRTAVRFRVSPRHATLEGLLRRRLQPTTSATAVRRDAALAVGGFYEQFRSAAGVEDIDLWWRLAAAGPCIVQEEPLVRYHIGDAKLRCRNDVALENLVADRELCIQRLRGRVPHRLYRLAAAQHHAVLARTCLLADHRAHGVRAAIRAVGYAVTPDAVAALAIAALPTPTARLVRKGRRRLLRLRV